ncbi:hypothetical protein [Polymorphospora rubra]|uniref:hypothetical protein n=1 Tax=Polymorphospora rubra TaxID=338584 RepID=UPI0033D4F267
MRPSIRRILALAAVTVATVVGTAVPAQAYVTTWYGPYGYYECEAAYNDLMTSGAPVPRTLDCQYRNEPIPGWYYATLT